MRNQKRIDSSEKSEPHLKIEDELLWLSNSTSNRLIANIVTNRIIRFFKLKSNHSSVLLSSLILSVFFLSIKVIITMGIFHSDFNYPTASILASFLISYSLATIRILHDIILPPNARKMLPEIEEKGYPLLRDWFKSFLSMRKQLVFSLVFSCLALSSLYCVEKYTSAKFDIGDYLLGFLAMFCVSHGGYCGIFIPTIAKSLRKAGMKLFWMNPVDSEPIRIASWGFRLLSMADAIFVTLCIVSLYWFKPWESRLVGTISGIWLVFGLLVVSYTFFYPHIYLDMAIREEKKKQLEILKNIISTYQDHIDKFTQNDFKNFEEYMKLYESMKNTKSSSVDMTAFRNYMTSLVVPTLSFISGFFDLKSLIQLVIH